jgi:hypothetical protein
MGDTRRSTVQKKTPDSTITVPVPDHKAFASVRSTRSSGSRG